ncbi:hypothetical protein [Snodgrassella alvi]|uniref:hypothetical protein n=1 Tax=Snodgrassella alvi TaxID=1196083 RepID=UPI0035174BE1
MSTLGVGDADELLVVVPFKCGGVTKGVDVAGDLVDFVPVMLADASQAVFDGGEALLNIVVKVIVFLSLAICFGPVMGDAPGGFGGIGKVGPLVVAVQAGGQAVVDEASAGVVGEGAGVPLFGIDDVSEVALCGVLVLCQYPAVAIGQLLFDGGDALWVLGMLIVQGEAGAAVVVGDFDDAAVAVAVKKEAVVVAILKCGEAEAVGLAGVGLEEAVKAVVVFDDPAVVPATADGEVFVDAAYAFAGL